MTDAEDNYLKSNVHVDGEKLSSKSNKEQHKYVMLPNDANSNIPSVIAESSMDQILPKYVYL